MLALVPWLRIGEPVEVGPFHVFPQGVGDEPSEGVTSMIAPETLGKVLAQYRDAANSPLRVVSVVQYDGRPLGADLDESERAAVFQFGQHLAVSGLSDRQFIGGFLDGYTASGHYQVVIQSFSEPFSGSVSLTHRRKDGHTRVTIGQSDAHFVRPAHLVSQGTPKLNLPLLSALQMIPSLPKVVHEHLDASIIQYLVANSDSPDVPLEVESIATYAALERVSDSDQSLKDIRRRLPAILAQVDNSPWAKRLRTELELPAESHWPELHTWLQQIYTLRGNVAHGKPASWAPQYWTQQEHIIAGAFIYPLALKCRLAQHGLFSPTLEDIAWTLGLERLLGDRPFFEVPTTPTEADEVDAPDEMPFMDALAMRDAARLRMTRWQRQFDRINTVLFETRLFADIQEAVKELSTDSSGVGEPKI